MKVKGQHEIVGFVLIVLIVSVIGVIFLSILFSKGGSNEFNSFEISNLLSSAMYSTSGCAINYIPQYEELQDLIKECFDEKSGNQRRCIDRGSIKNYDVTIGEDDLKFQSKLACDVLERDLLDILDSSLDVSEDSVNKGYQLKVYFKYRDEEIREENIILSLSSGIFLNCSAVVGGGHQIPESSGIIETKLSICKA